MAGGYGAEESGEDEFASCSIVRTPERVWPREEDEWMFSVKFTSEDNIFFDRVKYTNYISLYNNTLA
jgi:hypothetical protein